jgi:ferrous-iron efflux pump FieF
MSLVSLSLSDTSLRQVTARASVAVAATLIVAKLLAFWETGSVALLSSLVDSGVDLLASLITAYGVAKAAKPPDADHRFGHGKAEALAALVQALFIVGSSLFLVIEAVDRFTNLQSLAHENTGYLVMGFAILLTALLLLLQTHTIRRTKSLAIASDRLHYMGDILINVAVIATLYLQKKFNIFWIDPLFATFIAGGMVLGAFTITRKVLDVLMDAERPQKERKKILELASTIEGVQGVHDLRTRFDGERRFIDMHVEMAPQTTLEQAQKICDLIVKKIRTTYKNADIDIHPDPAGLSELRLDELVQEEDRTEEDV